MHQVTTFVSFRKCIYLGAIVISKMLYPQVEAIDNEISISQEKIGSNILESIANGTTEGLKLALNIGAMLLVF